MRFKICGIQESDIKQYTKIPAIYKNYKLPSKKTLAVMSPVADILYQETTVHGCTQSNIQFFIKKDCRLQPYVEGPFSAVNCMLKGSVVVQLREELQVELFQGQYNAYQVDESRHVAFFKKGHYEANHCDYTREAMERLAPASAIIGQWFSMMDSNSAAPVLPFPGIFTESMYKLTEEMKYNKVESVLDEELLYLQLQSMLTLVLRDQAKRDYTFLSEGNNMYEAMKGYIEAHIGNKITLETLSNAYHVSVSNLKKGFRKNFGKSFSSYLLSRRMEKAQNLLKVRGQNIHKVATMLGYDYAGNFSQAYKRYFGHLPMEMPLGMEERGNGLSTLGKYP
ncbi:helix-turn-helix transcriptional regulator [Chitinophaga cymbidii]|uniref:HTH araC/xylS-type domain-containing protein n=1 Tax=Chitinophaga cymbidii TaxID=1096750 RepID=A0A512RJ63_9BACT|nr:helix-turn-helix transcriptional regulator [Chitinophaga cymbidii]GEP95714.1 hypothetical protein CCY01nite_19740 [Chitinophaga cymbidii]